MVFSFFSHGKMNPRITGKIGKRYRIYDSTYRYPYFSSDVINPFDFYMKAAAAILTSLRSSLVVFAVSL